MKRPSVGVLGLRILRELAARGGVVATAAALVTSMRTQHAWGVLATLRGRALVAWDDGGVNVRLTKSGLQYLRSRRGI